MLPPGAPMSGLMARSGDMPYEENDDIRLPIEFTNESSWFVHVIVTAPPARRPLISAPSVSEMATTGIATGGAGGVGTTVGETRPGALLYSTTATAPAAWALIDFS